MLKIQKKRQTRNDHKPEPFLQRKGAKPVAQEGDMPFLSRQRLLPAIQTKPLVLDDKNAEREADQMGERFQRMPMKEDAPPKINRMPSGQELPQRKCKDCDKEKQAEQEKKKNEPIASEKIVQRKAQGNAPPSPAKDIKQRLQRQKGKGESLPPDIQTKAETLFDTNFSNVNLHTDADAVQLSKDLQAQAFTQGPDIYFNKGKYEPGSSGGRKLLGHEMAHVVQQGAALNQGDKSQPQLLRNTNSESPIQRQYGGAWAYSGYNPQQPIVSEITKQPNETENIFALRKLLWNSKVEEAIQLIGELVPDELNADIEPD